ncbi:TadE/TadG family type IV pilus assembly protein [Parerythrobacter jejuensis]|uniref:Pilus assembly protein n=1 Tax=Parerythrobacter jejuensis TaxID=795812 RepID=A0A845ASF3_9SPHN|nr:TadE/TadG family type IV pilus assembly protein [Parerythrobacter jejuensis]MXP32409.1 pilus assembly protein [Parerythrobacter jejuensis]
MIRRLVSTLRQDRSGATIVEFGMISPAIIVMMLGVFDITYNMYSSSLLTGAVQQAARASALEGANASTQNAAVEAAVQRVAPHATFTHKRVAYTTFTEVGSAESYDDLNGDSVCNDGEPFEDANGNGFWDDDRGVVGLGGARDAVVYTVSIDYPRVVPIASFIGVPNHYKHDVQTVLRNQPWALQSGTSSAGNCP